jgi:hypothetical protein
MAGLRGLTLALACGLLVAGCIIVKNNQDPDPPETRAPHPTARSAFPTTSPVNPWTSLDFQNDPDNFQFAIVTDRTGGHRPGVFETGISKLMLLHPEFVMSVGDMIEGYTEDEAEIDRQWEQFEGFLKPLTMPFFHVPGNHDLSNPVEARKWDQRFGRSYYHFVYRDVLFLCLSSEDGSEARMSPQQVEYFRKALAENRNVRWTLAFLHEPLWVYEDQAKAENSPDVGKTGWLDFEKLLQDRPYSIFAGHIHQYTKYERLGRSHIVLSTMGGASQLRGPSFGEFDHVVWVTMTEQGPVVANLWLEGIFDQNIVTADQLKQIDAMLGAARITAPALITRDAEFSSAKVQLRLTNDSNYPMTAKGRFAENALLRPQPSAIDRVVRPNSVELVDVTITAPPQTQVDQLKALKLKWDLSFDRADQPRAALSSVTVLSVQRFSQIAARTTPVTVDGALDEWPAEALASRITQPSQVLKAASTWTGPDDASFSVTTAQDAENLYIAIDVRDEKLVSDLSKMAWEQDGVEVRLDARADPQRSQERGDAEYSGGFTTIVLSPGQDDRTSGLYQREKWPAGTKAVCKATPTGYAVEIAIPSAALDAMQGQPWTAVRLNVAVDDADSAGEPAQLWFRPDWRSDDNMPGSGTFVRKPAGASTSDAGAAK